MKVTLINKDDSGGGAAMACRRLFHALKSEQADVSMLVQDKRSADEGIRSTIKNRIGKLRSAYNFLYERLSFMTKERDKSVRFAFSTAITGTDISNDPLVKDADIVHLHWTNGGFLSLDNVDQLLGLNKPVVWTLHDMWPFTGGCHYPGPSDRFMEQCGNCHFLKNPHPRDMSHTGWQRKEALYKRHKNITFVACSNWMREKAQKSSLLQGFEVITIPNTIDTEVFIGRNKIQCRKKWGVSEAAKVILFGAANINHMRKGIKYLVEALHLLKDQPGALTHPVEVVVFGKSKGFDFNQIPFPVVNLPVIKSEADLAEIYSLADTFVLPSLEDNLPNMVMEALSCSTPVVAFHSGGIGDMIEHKANGYLAEFKSVTDLADGILYILNSSDNRLGTTARQKIVAHFSYARIAEEHLNLYRRLLSEDQ